MSSAPLPFVSYSSLTEVVAEAGDWQGLYASLQTLKGHVQEYPGCQRFDVFIRAEDGGDVRIHCYTTWDTSWQLEAFLERVHPDMRETIGATISAAIAADSQGVPSNSACVKMKSSATPQRR